MAKATMLGVTLELTEREAVALRTLLNVTCSKGLFVEELHDIYTALAGFQVHPSRLMVNDISGVQSTVYLVEA